MKLKGLYNDCFATIVCPCNQDVVYSIYQPARKGFYAANRYEKYQDVWLLYYTQIMTNAAFWAHEWEVLMTRPCNWNKAGDEIFGERLYYQPVPIPPMTVMYMEEDGSVMTIPTSNPNYPF